MTHEKMLMRFDSCWMDRLFFGIHGVICQQNNLKRQYIVPSEEIWRQHLKNMVKDPKDGMIDRTVDGRNPKQPPGMYKTLNIMDKTW